MSISAVMEVDRLSVTFPKVPSAGLNVLNVKFWENGTEVPDGIVKVWIMTCAPALVARASPIPTQIARERLGRLVGMFVLNDGKLLTDSKLLFRGRVGKG